MIIDKISDMEGAPKQPEIIKITEDRDLLLLKLEEYKARLDSYKPPEAQIRTIYKIAILEKLLETGEVNLEEVKTSIMDKGYDLDEDEFLDAWGVIDDYVKTGGKNNYGGTGLPKRGGFGFDN